MRNAWGSGHAFTKVAAVQQPVSYEKRGGRFATRSDYAAAPPSARSASLPPRSRGGVVPEVENQPPREDGRTPRSMGTGMIRRTPRGTDRKVKPAEPMQ